MPSPHFHKDRVKQDLLREIGWTIANLLRDPRIPQFVTVTEVRLSDDNRNATVFISVYGDGKEQEAAIEALNHAAPFIQTTVAGRVTMKHFPKLYFKVDKSLERSRRINDLLGEVKDDLERP